VAATRLKSILTPALSHLRLKRLLERRGSRSLGRVARASRQQISAVGRGPPQTFEPHWHRRADPQRILAVVVIRALRQRMDQHVETLAVQHQPRHDSLELLSLEDDVELRDRVRADRLVAEGSGLDSELADDRVTQPLGERPGGGVVINMGVIALDFVYWCPPAGVRADV
jgi:hypothetical protein